MHGKRRDERRRRRRKSNGGKEEINHVLTLAVIHIVTYRTSSIERTFNSRSASITGLRGRGKGAAGEAVGKIRKEYNNCELYHQILRQRLQQTSE